MGHGSVRRFSTLDLDGAPLRDYSGLSESSRRIGAASDFFINIGKFKATVAATAYACAHAILGISLNDAVRNSQGISGLPVYSVAAALHRDVQVLQPADTGKLAERTGRVDRRIARGGIAVYATVPQAGIEPVEQEGLVIVNLHVAAESSTCQGKPGGNVEQAGLLSVDLNEWALAARDCGTSARINQSDVLIKVGVRGIADEDAGVVHPAFNDGS